MRSRLAREKFDQCKRALAPPARDRTDAGMSCAGFRVTKRANGRAGVTRSGLGDPSPPGYRASIDKAGQGDHCT